MSLFDFKNKDLTPEEAERRKKRATVRYFSIVFSKFSKLVLLNLLYFLCILPMFCGITTFACLVFKVSADWIEKIYFLRIIITITHTVISFSGPLSLILFLASAIAYGPLTAGLTFCVRNLATERQIWMSDLFTRAKSNLKQGIALGIIDLVVLFSAILYLSLDLSAVQGGSLAFYTTLRIVALIIALIYFVVRFYTYTIAVTIELPIKHIFRNSLLFCLPGFFRNLLALLICFVIVYSFTSTPKIDIVLVAALLFSIARFSVVFATYKVIDTYLIKPTEKKDEPKTPDNDKEEE